MFVLLWVLLIRLQRQRQQKHQSLLSSVEPGDEILTVGGLYGIVRRSTTRTTSSSRSPRASTCGSPAARSPPS